MDGISLNAIATQGFKWSTTSSVKEPAHCLTLKNNRYAKVKSGSCAAFIGAFIYGCQLSKG
jgi:hypothetical protein